MALTTMASSKHAHREFLHRYLVRLNEATLSNTAIELDIYFVTKMFVETALLDYEFDTTRGFYDQTMDAIEIADALL